MSKIKFKIITGFRENQYYTIDADEAHKAYYLFKNPEERGIFSNGVALIGRNIQGIEPDWHAIMDYNQDYVFDYVDWNLVKKLGLDKRARKAMQVAKDVSDMIPDNPNLLKQDLSTCAKELNLLETNVSKEADELAEKFKPDFLK